MEIEAQSRWRALVGISVLSFVVFIDFTVVNTILPAIQRELHASVGELQWIMNAFFMMLTVFMVTMGRVGDIYGQRRALYTGVAVFALASFAAGVSPSIEVLIACRTVQGIAAAVAVTCGAALVTHHFPEQEQGRALAIFMSITGFGLAIGPVIGGLFVSTLSWRWAFYVNVPVVITGFLIAYGAVRETSVDASQKIDWKGLALMIPAVACLVIGLMQGNDWGWRSPWVLGLLGVSAISSVLFFIVERGVPEPIIDFGLLRSRTYLACIVVALTLGGFIALGNFLAPLYLQNVRNEIPYQAGLMLLPISGMVALVPPLIGGLADRYGSMRFLVIGQAVLVIAAAVQLTFEPATPIWLVLVGLGLFGIGWGLQQATTPTVATSALPQSAAGLAIGAVWTFWNLGSCLAMAVGGLIFEYRDRVSLNSALASENIKLSAADGERVRSLLSDPSQAHEILSKLSPGLEAKIFPLFQDAFMSGYSGAMWYLLVICTIGTVLVYILGRTSPG